MTTLSSPPQSAPPRTKARNWLLGSLLLVLLATLVAYDQIDRPLTGIDDANIFFTYGQHFAQGDGFIYYQGGERVEGFTSLLWTIICSLCFLLTPHPEPLLLGINIVLLSGTVTLSLRFLQTSGAPETYSKNNHFFILPIALWAWCLLNPKFVIWATITLMDLGLWCFALTAGTLAFARAATSPGPLSRSTSYSLCGYLALALLTRPEAILLGLVWLAGLLLCRHITRNLANPDAPVSIIRSVSLGLRECRVAGLAYLLILGSLTGFRLLYFGYPLPNTFYAKVSPNLLYNLKLGLGYLRGFFFDQFWAVVCCTIVGLRTWRLLGVAAGRIRKPRFLHQSEHSVAIDFIAFTTAASISATILTGGDHFALYRFFQPIWPLLFIAGFLPLFFWVANHISTQPKWLRFLLYCLLISTFYCSQEPWWNQVSANIQHEFDLARGGRKLGRRLNQLLPAEKNVSLGIITAGGIGYTYQGPLLDLMGLNNVRMGHSPGDRKGNKNHAAFNAKVFFQLSPDLVDPRFVADRLPNFRQDLIPNQGSFWDGAMQQVHNSKPFHDLYRAILITCPESHGEPRTISAWCKPALITHLVKQGIKVRVLPAAGE